MYGADDADEQRKFSVQNSNRKTQFKYTAVSRYNMRINNNTGTAVHYHPVGPNFEFWEFF